jgi:hypothetical protein
MEDMREVLNTQGLPRMRPRLEDVVILNEVVVVTVMGLPLMRPRLEDVIVNVTKVGVTELGLRPMLAHTHKEEAEDEDEEPADVTTKNKMSFKRTTVLFRSLCFFVI